MAASKRKHDEDYKAYQARLNREERLARIQEQGTVLFQSTHTNECNVLIGYTAQAVRDGAMMHKSGRRRTTSYIIKGAI